jgi:hypothetical protein
MQLCPLPITLEALAHYGENLQLADLTTAAVALARAIATSPTWEESPNAIVIVRPAPQPRLTVLGCFDADQEASLVAQARGLGDTCAALRYVDYAKAESDCEQLAAQLTLYFGSSELDRLRFTAIPRGGHIVLGMLAYILGLSRPQLSPPHPSDIPLVVIDDCAITGARLGSFLARCESKEVFFAHLYSHPDLRTALKEQEPRVKACFSAQDLDDHGYEQYGDEYPEWKERWLNRIDDHRFWLGRPEHICFAWGEPDRSIWNPVTYQVESAWHILPSELCLKNRPSSTSRPVPVQVQPSGKGPLKPSEHVVFGRLGEQTVVGDVKTGRCFALEGVAADMWQAFVTYGNLEDAGNTLLADYDVTPTTLSADLLAFADDLLARGLMDQNEASSNGE